MRVENKEYKKKKMLPRDMRKVLCSRGQKCIAVLPTLLRVFELSYI